MDDNDYTPWEPEELKPPSAKRSWFENYDAYMEERKQAALDAERADLIDQVVKKESKDLYQSSRSAITRSILKSDTKALAEWHMLSASLKERFTDT